MGTAKHLLRRTWLRVFGHPRRKQQPQPKVSTFASPDSGSGRDLLEFLIRLAYTPPCLQWFQRRLRSFLIRNSLLGTAPLGSRFAADMQPHQHNSIQEARRNGITGEA